MGAESGTRPYWNALGATALAVGAGCALLVALGAPSHMPMVNGAALAIGLSGVAAIWSCRRAGGAKKAGDIALLIASALIPLTALAGPQAHGVARWLVVGGLTIQPAMIAVPLVALGFALRPAPIRSAAVAVSALGLAMQPDPGCAAMLLLGVLAPLRTHEGRTRGTLIAVVAAAIGFALAIARNVTLAPVPFVEGVIPDAFRLSIVPAILALAAILLMLAPAFARPLRAPHFAFLGVWIGAIAMALLGPYPTPVIGFGGSGVLGFVLSAGLLALGTAPRRR